MSVMAEVARRHCFQVLLHEKPFDGINGSGKHNNWSLGTDRGDMLFSAGKSPKENLRFICFIANVMAAVDRHNALLKASIASAPNAHRLGAGDISTIETLSAHLDAAGRLVRELVEARKVANRIGSEREKAIAYHDTVVPLMDEIRRHIDKLELMVDDEIWPLPKYREMLFIR